MGCKGRGRAIWAEVHPVHLTDSSIYRAKQAGSGPGRNSADRRLKWLNSLYRPAVPEECTASPVPPPSRPVFGASPSGKAGDFDSPMRRFESSRPSQLCPGRRRLEMGFNPKYVAGRPFSRWLICELQLRVSAAASVAAAAFSVTLCLGSKKLPGGTGF